jgi:class 3 adenylate cyclase
VEDQPSRKLAVIVHADVEGSTTLVRQDETLAHQRIQDAFRRFSETIASHNGITREIRGDALIAEFARASDAVAASVEFQTANGAYTQALPDSVRPAIRVGIAMGEVVVSDNTVTGEGVVLAQRLEQSAEAGGVCIQGAAYETIPKRLPYDFENLGELVLKGFDEPVRAYAVTSRSEASAPTLEHPVRGVEGRSNCRINLRLPCSRSLT